MMSSALNKGHCEVTATGAFIGRLVFKADGTAAGVSHDVNPPQIP
jgi:hypothetical protein